MPWCATSGNTTAWSCKNVEPSKTANPKKGFTKYCICTVSQSRPGLYLKIIVNKDQINDTYDNYCGVGIRLILHGNCEISPTTIFNMNCFSKKTGCETNWVRWLRLLFNNGIRCLMKFELNIDDILLHR